MTDRIRHFFKHNKLLKLISLAIAFAIWLLVVNASNPEIKSNVSSSIDIDYGESLTNLDKYYSLDTYTARVSFSVRTNQRAYVSSSDFRVYVDMRDYSITGALPVYVTIDDRVKDIVSDVTVSPLVVHATTEDMQEKSFDLVPDIVGTPSDGFAAGEVEYSPSHITLYGPDSEIGRISSIGFDVNVEGASSNVWGTADFTFYDANGNEITPDERIIVKNSVSYNIPVYQKKNVSITVQASGEPAEGYELGAIDCEPDFLEIYGDESALESINALILPSSLLNVNGASSDITASIDISDYLPDGIYTTNVGNVALVARINKSASAVSESESPDGNESTESENPSETDNGSETEAGSGNESGTSDSRDNEQQTVHHSSGTENNTGSSLSDGSGDGAADDPDSVANAAASLGGSSIRNAGENAGAQSGASGTHNAGHSSDTAASHGSSGSVSEGADDTVVSRATAGSSAGSTSGRSHTSD